MIDVISCKDYLIHDSIIENQNCGSYPYSELVGAAAIEAVDDLRTSSGAKPCSFIIFAIRLRSARS